MGYCVGVGLHGIFLGPWGLTNACVYVIHYFEYSKYDRTGPRSVPQVRTPLVSLRSRAVCHARAGSLLCPLEADDAAGHT
eukprot:1837815-Prymnesium_polylepis.1